MYTFIVNLIFYIDLRNVIRITIWNVNAPNRMKFCNRASPLNTSRYSRATSRSTRCS